jgi:NAD(P)-dependent dehydrogenase (short-subunit alcohol dehydrogenase family)
VLIEKAALSRTRLEGKVAIVTGAGQGIGRETARILAYIGCDVVLAEINDSGAETEEVIRGEGGRALYVKTDVSDPVAWQNLRQKTLESFGAAHILINNAATYTFKPILQIAVEEWDRIVAVNLRGAFVGIKTFLPDMLAQRDGVVITMESAEGMPYMAPYLATKVGLRSLALSLAQEVGTDSGVSVYCFGPGIVATPGALGGFKQLAPLYGLTEAEFIEQSGLELVSAEVCATGLVGTILYAADYHGQETGYAAGLMKLGLATSGEAIEAAPQPTMNEAPLGISHGLDEAALWPASAEANRRVEEILRTNIREYSELTMFQRPIVKRMFQQGTGLSVENWLTSAEEMTEWLDQQVAGAGALDRARVSSYLAQLRKFAEFITKQESDARGWIRDPQKLVVALEALRERQALIRHLIELLEAASP